MSAIRQDLRRKITIHSPPFAIRIHHRTIQTQKLTICECRKGKVILTVYLCALETTFAR
jgi:hypothetical protein